MTALPWVEATGLIEQADDVVLVCHVQPDGDALGSMLGLGLALAGRGARVRASWGSEPFAVPRAYDYLPGQELLVPAAELPAAPALLVTLDTSSADRLGTLAPLAAAAERLLVLDHHAGGQPYGGTRLVDPSAAATAVVVAELLDRLGVPLTEPIATALYTGLVTDTGSFKHSSTTPAVHELAARLVAAGVRPDEVGRAVWDTQSFGWVGLLGDVCARARLEPAAARGRGLVWTCVETADLERHGLGLPEVEGVIDVLRTAAEADVAAVLKRHPDGVLHVSTRSRGATDVGAACTGLGGGGHRLAAGYTAGEDLDEAVEVLRRALA